MRVFGRTVERKPLQISTQPLVPLPILMILPNALGKQVVGWVDLTL